MKAIEPRAEVTEAFRGARDGQVYPEDLKVGDVIEGDLARAGIEMGKAKEITAEPAKLEAPATKQQAPHRRKSK